MTSVRARPSLTSLLVLVASATTSRLPADEIDFVDDVQPVFAKHCTACHGPQAQESGLRLDDRALLLRGGDSGEPAVVLGKPARSYLLRVVAGKDDLKMPPEGKPLSPEEVGVIHDWIRQGAKMPAELSGQPTKSKGSDHWSFQPLAATPPPRPRHAFVSGGNPVDAFVLRGLVERGLEPSPRADRRTRVRRLYLVMHGLPPTRAEINEFLNDDRPDAWARLVDRVLASPRYGERWAQHWFDVVRFGETHGFETNRERPNAWPYRDYVIRSLNEDEPYDQFVREQLAGDALGEPVGTGFLVAGPYDLVKGGGNLAAVQRMNELDDMINTTGTAFLGLTLGCARCHNHKFDPVTQTDYYAVQAVFAGVQHGDARLPVSPETQTRITSLDREIGKLAERLSRFEVGARTTSDSDRTKAPPVNPRHNVETFQPVRARFVRFVIEETSRSQPCIDELEVFAGDENVAAASRGARATASGSLAGYAIHELAHVNDGKYGNAHSWICDKPTGWVQIELPETKTIDRIEWARDREGRYSDRLPVRYRIDVAVQPDKWRTVASSADHRPRAQAADRPSEPEYDFTGLPKAEAAQGRSWLNRLQAARAERAAIAKTGPAYVGRFTQPGETHRLFRGEPDQKREVVAPNAVVALGTLDLKPRALEQRRRIALANWIADDCNPLTARVVVNRLWQHHFGEGLVDTPSDFGANGTRPTHPELLDWLAGRLIAENWSLKSVHRLILTSSTWQQASRPSPRGTEVDGATRLLWRFPPRRLEAEAIRDSMLAVSGVLDQRMGGPGFSGFEVQRENVRHFFPKKTYGPEDWRRMVYMTKVRQEQESVFGAFDCPDGGQGVAKRSRSTTPLQALNLFNSTFVVEQSELFARRLADEVPESDVARAALAYELAFGRPAAADEASAALSFANEHGWPALCRALLNANEFVFVP